MMELNNEVVLQRSNKKNKFKKELISWAKTLVVVIILVTAFRAFLYTNYIVYGQSMMPTIQDRERVIINKIGYGIGEPERFDMIVFRATETTDYIKRVIGLPGDTIEFKNDQLYINGEIVEETFLNGTIEEKSRPNYPFTNDFTLEQLTGEKYVPEDHLFVLGDNRRNSIDSRQIGFVPFDRVIGKADLAYWPPSAFRLLK